MNVSLKDIKLPYWIPFVVLMLIFFAIFPRTAKFNYDYKKGSAWKYETLLAQFDFPILKTDEQISEEKSKAGSSVIPYYRYSEETVNKNIKAAESLSLGSAASLRPAIVSTIKSIYSHGVVSDEGVKLSRNSDDVSREVLYIQKDKRATKVPVTEVYKLTDAKAKLLADMAKGYKSWNLDSVFRSNNVYDLIVPNLVYDKQTTELVHDESAPTVSPTSGFVNAGQLIVSKDEIVTAEIEQILDSYKAEYEATMGYDGPKVIFLSGNFIIALVLALILFLCIFFTNTSLLSDMNRLAYLLFVIVVTACAAMLVNKANPTFLYMVPFPLAALWLQGFFPKKALVPAYIFSLLPLMIFARNGYVLFVMFLLAGLAAGYAFKFFSRSWSQFLVSLVIFVSLLVTYSGFYMIEAVNGEYFKVVAFLALGSIFSVAGYPLVFLYEKLFNLLSTSRLKDLAETDQPLLQELFEKAPGTYDHSLKLKNMVEVVGQRIGGGINVNLLRAGALYHDIGKMENPLCFTENSKLLPGSEGVDYHAGKTCLESAQDIISHVSSGLKIAERYKLPKEIRDFIATHHGTSYCSFYIKYLNEGGDAERKDEFCYKGPKPFTREQVILMVCDSVEAASRSMKSMTTEACTQFVDKIILGKIEQGQFNDANITIKDLTLMRNVLVEYLPSVNHERVAYPDRKPGRKSKKTV